ncbi:MAG: hypothetical protein WBE52_01345 [Terriglobales bacterium]
MIEIDTIRFRVPQVVCIVLLAWMLAGAQTSPDAQNKNHQNNQNNQTNDGKNAPSSAAAGTEYSGMYSFLRDGEFVQLTVEDNGRVTGFVSRYGDSETDHDVFLDHFFKSGKLDGNQLVFTTETVHGVSFEFRGTVNRGEGKNPGDEAYYTLKGTLVENKTDDANKTSAVSHEVALKSFPQDMSSPQDEKK